MSSSRRRLPLFLLVGIAAPLRAQLPPVVVPTGQVRIDIGGGFTWWDQVFVAGVRRAAIADLLQNQIVPASLPGLAQSLAALQATTGNQSLSISPGSTTGGLAVNLGRAELGLAIGITSRLTLFGTVPRVRVRVQEQLLIDSTNASAGFNPADPTLGTPAGAAATGAFLNDLGGALTSLNAAIQSGMFDQNPELLAEAQAALARGTTLQSDLQTLLLDSPFLPLAGSFGAQVLNGAIDSLRVRLSALDPVGGSLTSSPALPTEGLAPADFERYVTSAGGPIQAQAFEPEIYTALGDVEVGAAFALANGRSPEKGLALRAVLRGSVRLPTARLADPNALFATGTGERLPGFRGDLVTDLMAPRFGARIVAGVTVQQKAQLERRITAPDMPLAPQSSLALVERQGGTILLGSIQPYLRIAPHFSVVAGVTHWRKEADRYTYPPGQDPVAGLDPSVLAQGTRTNATILSGGLSLSNPGIRPGWNDRHAARRGGSGADDGGVRRGAGERHPERGVSASAVREALLDLLPLLFEHDQGVAASSLRVRIAQHPGELTNPIFAVNPCDVAGGDARPGALRDHQMAVRPGGNLGQVGNDQHLVTPSHFLERFGDPGPDFPSDTLIDLIEHQGGNRIVPGEHCAQGQHQTGELPTGGDPRQGALLHPLIELSPELHRLRPPAGYLRHRLQCDADPATGKAQPGKQAIHSPGQTLRGGGALLREGPRCGRHRRLECSALDRESAEVQIRGIQEIELLCGCRPRVEDRLEGGSVLLFQPVDEIPSGFDFGEPAGVVFQGAAVVANQSSQFAEIGEHRVQQLTP